MGDLSAARVLRAAIVSVFIALFFWKTLSVDLLIFAGVVLAVFLSKAAQFLSRHARFGYALSLAVVAILVVVIVGGLAWFFAQSVAGQFDELSQLLTKDFATLEQRLPDFIWSRLAQGFSASQLSTTFRDVLGIFSSAVGVVAAIAVVIFFGLYLAAEPHLYEAGLVRLVPPAKRDRIQALLAILANVLWAWLLGRLLSMAIIGIAVTAGLWLIGLPVPLALGLLAAAFALVPYIGAVVSAVPSLLLALTLDVWHALYVLLLYIAIHILEGYILIPLIQRRAAHVPPALALASQLIMGVIAGLLGLFLAMPLAAVLIPTIRLLYIEDLLGDPLAREERP